MFRWSKKKKHAGDSEQDATTDQVTQRFTINLPNGQKNVARVSPLMTLGDLVISVCKEKGLDLDLSRYALQYPKNPGIPIDFSTSIQQIGVQELNLISLVYQDRNYAMSMPDLSKLPPSGNQPHLFTPPGGKSKKKRGFLSFLGKKDKKYKSQFSGSLDTNINSNFTMSTPPAPRPTTPPGTQRRSSDQKLQTDRPKSMFVSSNKAAMEDTIAAQTLQPVAPARKKRRAPEPPASADFKISEKEQIQSPEDNILLNRDRKESPSVEHMLNNINEQEEITVGSSQHLLQYEPPNSLHSCNSSDSSGYHELTLSRCESPEATRISTVETKTRTDMTSLDSTDNANKDNRKHSSPVKVLSADTEVEGSKTNIESVTPSSVADSLTTGISDISTSNMKIPETNLPILTIPCSAASIISPSLSYSVTETTTSSKTSVTQADFEEKSQPFQKPNQKLPDFDDSQNEPATFDINDILEGVVFDEEPWSMDLTLAKRAGIEQSDKDPLMMMETASVTSEDIEQIGIFSSLHRPCSFIPPPPPLEPPPPEHEPVDVESFTLSTAPIFIDKGTEVNDDNISLATSSAKNSPGRVSSGSMSEMALFIDKMTLESTEEGDNKLFHHTMSSPYKTASDNYSDGSAVIWHRQTDSRDSGSEMRSVTTVEQKKLKDTDLQSHENHEDFESHMNESSVVYAEISQPLTYVPSLQTSNNKDGMLQENKNSDVNDESDDEEYYTEIIEELIIPFGPNGYDFAAARKKPDAEIKTVRVIKSLKEKKRKEKNNVISTKSDSVIQLSSASTQSGMSSKSLIRSKPDHTMVSIRTTDNHHYENVQPEIAQNDIFNSYAQHVSMTEENPKTLPKLPTTKHVLTNNLPAVLGDDNLINSDPIITKSRPHLLKNSHSNSLHRSTVHEMGHAAYLRNDSKHQSSYSNGAGSVVGADVQQLDNISASNADVHEQQDAFQRQYYALQSQFQQWQEQLAWNQSLLASQAVGSELQVEQLQQMTEQMVLQQQMMQQLQSTMLALQKQQQIHDSGQEHVELSADLPARVHQPVAGAAEPAYVVAASPRTSLSPLQKKSKVMNIESTTAKQSPKFERELGPRDKLMIAIRTFAKGNLKSVPIEKTRWTSSALL